LLGDNWRWMCGMLAWLPDGDWRRLSEPYRFRVSSVDSIDFFDSNTRVIPDLTDPATLGCLLALVREVHGGSTVVRRIKTDEDGEYRWELCDRDSGGCTDWDLYMWKSESDALVAALDSEP